MALMNWIEPRIFQDLLWIPLSHLVANARGSVSSASRGVPGRVALHSNIESLKQLPHNVSFFLKQKDQEKSLKKE